MKKINVHYDNTFPSDLIEVIAKEDCDTIKKIKSLIEEKNCKHIIGERNNQFYNISISDVFHFFCKDSCVFFTTDKYVFEVKDRLYEIEDKLNSLNFIKINKSEIINIDKVMKFDLTFSAKIYVHLNNGYICSVSRRNLKKIKTLIGVKR